jgi:hypothetical protein
MKYVLEFLFMSLLFVFAFIICLIGGLWHWDFTDLKRIIKGYKNMWKKLFNIKNKI